MNASFQNTLTLVARILLALMFVTAGFGKIGGFAGTAGYIASVGLPAPQLLAAASIAVEIGAGLALIVGWQLRWAALALAVFTVLASLFFHNYWALPVDKQMVPKLMFMKNLAVTGGLLALAAWGAGAFSLDARRRPSAA